MQPLLTLKQTAEHLQLSLRQVRRLVDGGRIPVVKISERSPRVRMEDLTAFLASVMVRHSAPAP